MDGLVEHWNRAFAGKADSDLGWYEGDVRQTLTLLDLIPSSEITTAFLPGAGTSLLVDELLARGLRLVLNDISDEALARLKHRIGKDGDRVVWLHHDISKPLPVNIPQIDLWVDRAVLHFLLDEADITGYFRNLLAILKPGGHVLLAEFSEAGATRCAGLDVHRYSVAEMAQRLGLEFSLVKAEDYIFTNPAGAPRPYVYALFRRD
jgi:EEF1A lysine methyltransferase 2